jgi:energy-coupling factor transporter transmembrane protein EcfT
MKISKLINYSNKYVWEAAKVLLLLLLLLLFWVWFTINMTFEPQASFIHPNTKKLKIECKNY